MRTSLHTIYYIILIPFLSPLSLSSQITDSCAIEMGINLAGISDYSREIPFANAMKTARSWYTKGENDSNYTWDTGYADSLAYDNNGYPTHIPQTFTSTPLPQLVATVWDGMDSWPTGTYTLLWDGTGNFNLWGAYSNLVKVSSNRIEFEYTTTPDALLQITMIASDINDPVNNMRLLLPGTESTYQTQPFNQDWLDELGAFGTLRFMDWGHTNNWGQVDPYSWQEPTLVDWNERAGLDYYTYTGSKGVPYELMVDLINELEVDGWVCVPHRASNNYISNMADYFRDNVDSDRHIIVEYSNEIWNWIFGQAQWLNEYPCNSGTAVWPECTVSTIQNTLDLWSASFSSEMDRISRVAPVQTGWLDVSERIVYNLTPGSYDLISPTFYFSYDSNSESILDGLGSSATVADIAYHTRLGMAGSLSYINNMKTISDSLNIPLAFYEGGQHMTPIPFGSMPSYQTALEAIHRDTAMYNLYNEWFDDIRALNTTDDPMLLMHFSFITPLSAQYGSWGILETMDQDLTTLPAPKFEAVMENMGCQMTTSAHDVFLTANDITLYPNPTMGLFTITGSTSAYTVNILDSTGSLFQTYSTPNDEDVIIDISSLPSGMYFVSVSSNTSNDLHLEKIIKF